MRYDDKVVLVTGGSTGIGAATAKLLIERGAKVVITGRGGPALAETAAAIGAHPVVADLKDLAAAVRAVHEVEKRHGRLDVLVNNAGIAPIAALSDATPEHTRQLFDVNVLGLIETTRAALPLLRASRGTVVNVTTTLADRPMPQMTVYSATKAAVLCLTRGWAKELAAHGIRVNAVSPGPVGTPLFTPEKLGVPQATIDQIGARVLGAVPLQRFGAPMEIAEVIAFLASDAASYVTGAEYTAGGGLEAS